MASTSLVPAAKPSTKAPTSPLHEAVDAAVDRACEFSCIVSKAELALRSGNHSQAGKHLAAAHELLASMLPIITVAEWECARASSKGRVKLKRMAPTPRARLMLA